MTVNTKQCLQTPLQIQIDSSTHHRKRLYRFYLTLQASHAYCKHSDLDCISSPVRHVRTARLHVLGEVVRQRRHANPERRPKRAVREPAAGLATAPPAEGTERLVRCTRRLQDIHLRML